MVVMNDWSARDIQKWEYVPLGESYIITCLRKTFSLLIIGILRFSEDFLNDYRK